MKEIGNILIITRQEYEDYEKKARIIQAQKDSRTLNMRLRFPYYIPYVEDVAAHQYIPLSQIVPYYIYLTTLDENGEYLVEPDNEELNETRKYMSELYESRIYVVEDKEEEKQFADKIINVQKSQ